MKKPRQILRIFQPEAELDGSMRLL